MDNKSPEENDDERWDEFKWEEFLKESDERADKFGRIMEQYADDPNLQEIIAREMGWDKEIDDEKAEEWNSFFEDAEADEEGEEWKAAADIKDRDGLPNFDDDPLYKKAFEVGIDSWNWAQQLPEAIRDHPDVVEIVSNATIPAAKIAFAYPSGDAPEFLGLRIAAYKRGLAAANKSLDAINSLREKNLVDPEKLSNLTKEMREVRNGLAIRILELREEFNKK